MKWSFQYGLRGDDLMTKILAFAGIEIEAGSGDRLMLLDLPSGQIYEGKDAATQRCQQQRYSENSSLAACKQPNWSRTRRRRNRETLRDSPLSLTSAFV
jgi:hypothetical protein